MKHKLLTVLLALLAALCLSFGLAACGESGGNGGNGGSTGGSQTEQGGGTEGGTGGSQGEEGGETCAHQFTADNVCSLCGDKWEFTEGLTYELDEETDTYHVLHIQKESGDVVVPYGYQGKFVTAVYGWTTEEVQEMMEASIGGPDDLEQFFVYSLTGITLPDSVTSVEDYVFMFCQGLKSANLGKGLTSIGYGAFGYSGLTSIIIPDSVTLLGEAAFVACSELTSATIGSGVMSIGNSAFAGCIKLEKINITDLVTWCKIDFINGNNPLEYAGHLFLNGTEITNLTIPDSVTSITYGVFYGCIGLKSVTISSGVTSIENGAFNGCTELEHIKVAAGNTVYRSENDCLIEIQSDTLILGCKNSTIPDSVTSIGEGAFDGCSGLTSIEIPDSVTSIGNSAFSRCSGLKSVTIGSGVTSIGNSAFSWCSGLTSVIWNAENCTTTGDYYSLQIFSECTQLATVTFGENVKTIPAYVFYGCSKLVSIEIPDSVTSIGVGAFYGTAYYDDASHWDTSGVLYIDNHLIKTKNTLLDKYSIRENTKTIGDSAFSDCNRLTNITIPDSVTSIGVYAFENCSELTNIIIPDSVTSIGYGAFENCGELTNITIPDSVTSIGGEAFAMCVTLTSVTIGCGVTKVDAWAFIDCRRLTDIHFNGTVTEWQAVEKLDGWDRNTPDYTVTCTDGTVDKDGNVTYFNS